ncbi:MAG: hypothetical protein ACOYM3_25100 [Terrimicrobiaceae bacterium]
MRALPAIKIRCLLPSVLSVSSGGDFRFPFEDKMLRRLSFLFCGLMVCACIQAQLPADEPLRGWKTVEGQAFEAAIVSFDGTTVTFRVRNGQRSPLPLARLSPDDQMYLDEWQKKQPLKIVLPDVVGGDPASLQPEVLSEDERNEKFVYRTGHFEFESQGKFTQSLLREVARNFEATYELLKALPWGIEPAPASGEYFRARLLRTRSVYEAEGGPKNSGGVYLGREKVFLVPFESIGLKTVGKSYAKDDDFDTSTLVHELTHQMMHFWLNYLPQWVVEGTAEYTGILPLKTGRFRVSAAKTGLRDYLEHLQRAGGVPVPYPLEELFPMTNEKWNEILTSNRTMSHRLYFTSYLLVYYFMHLDGDGDGQLFVRYFRAVGAVRKEVEEYDKAVDEFKKQPRVEVLPDGRYRGPGGLKHPDRPAILESETAPDEFQRKTLQILLNGRTEAELTKQIRAAYAKLGIRL